MPRKKSKINLLPAAKFAFVGLLALVIGVGLFKGAAYVLFNAPYFKIKKVVVDPSLDFISWKT